jgi:adenylate cyclase
MVNPAEIHGAKLLIVDDLPSDVLLLKNILGAEGYGSVDSTLDPVAVCELHRKNHYDLILLDLNMPVMSGFEVMEGLKGIGKDEAPPVLVVTAQPEHWLRALQAGAKDFVSKPFRLPEVLKRVHDVLEGRLASKRPGQAV